jgi:cytochrome c oxidase cbb3-type subunit 2
MDTLPRDFTKGVFKFRTTREGMPTEEDLYRSITAGFPAYGMPSFVYLPNEERWALVHYVEELVRRGLEDKFRRMAEEEGEEYDSELVEEWLEPGSPIQLPPEPPGAELVASVARGRELFKGQTYNCASCHGDSGTGDGPSAADLKDEWGNPIRPRDLTKGWVFRKSGWRTEDTVRVILYGIPGTPMPANTAATETPEGIRDVWDIARYIDHLMSDGEGGGR